MAYASLLTAALIWGGNAIVSKASAGVIAPASMAFWRWVLAVLLLTPFVARGTYANWQAIRGQLGRLAVLGLLGFAAFPALMYLAARFTSAIHIGLIQAVMPLLVLGISIALLGQRLTPGAVVGGVLSLCGVGVVVSHGQLGMLVAHGPGAGDMLMLAASVCYAVYIVLLKHWHPGIPLPQSLYVQAAAAVVFLLPLDLLGGGRGPSPASLPLIAYAAAAASIAAPLAWMYGIGRVGPARASLFINLVPLITAVLAVVLLAERLASSVLVGGAMTIGGVLVAELWQGRAAGREKARQAA